MTARIHTLLTLKNSIHKIAGVVSLIVLPLGRLVFITLYFRARNSPGRERGEATSLSMTSSNGDSALFTGLLQGERAKANQQARQLMTDISAFEDSKVVNTTYRPPEISDYFEERRRPIFRRRR